MKRAAFPTIFLFLSVVAAAPAHAAEVLSPFEDCDKQVRLHPDQPASYFCFTQVAIQNNLWEEAIRRLEGFLSLDPDNTYALVVLAQTEQMRGRDRAEEFYQKALAVYEKIGTQAPSHEVIFTLKVYSQFLRERGRMNESEDLLAEAAIWAERSGDPVQLAVVQIDQAWIAYLGARYDEAEALLGLAKPHLFPDGNPYQQAKWYATIGSVRGGTGRLQDALESYRRQAQVMQEAEDRHAEATALSNMALARQAQYLKLPSEEKKVSLLNFLQEAMEVAIAGGNLSAQVDLHLTMANLVGDTLESREHIRAGLNRSRERKDIRGTLDSMQLLAASLIQEEPRAPGKGFRLLEDSLREARRIGDPMAIAESAVVQQRMEWWMVFAEAGNRNRKEAAIQSSLAALDAIEAIRNRQIDSLVRARSLTNWIPHYTSIAGNLLRIWKESRTPADLELAFQVMEQFHARTLLDELDAAHAAEALFSPGPLGEKRSRVLKEIAEIRRRLAPPGLREEERRDLLAQLEIGETEEETLRAEIARSDPLFATIRVPQTIPLQELQSSLDEDEALFLFQIAEEEHLGYYRGGSWLLVNTRGDTRVFELPEKKEIEDAVEVFSALVLNRDGSEIPGAVRLYRDLLQAAIEQLPAGINRLILVPDGPLHRLPFAALRARLEDEPIGSAYQITLAPSATTWVRWRNGIVSSAEVPALAMIDPDLSLLMRPGSSAVESEISPKESTRAAEIRDLGPLPHARSEARAILRNLGGGSRSVEGEAATEHFLKETDLTQFGILHFGAHALIDAVHSDRSGVLLAPGGGEDGILQIREVVDLDLRGGTVVLATCQSASGQFLEGEGVLSLARAFFIAGAHAVIGSLWPLKDDEAAKFFERFYLHLGEGNSLEAALTKARRDQIRAGTSAAAWAGLVLIGDGSLVPLPSGKDSNRYPILYSGLILSLLIAAIAFYLYQRRFRTKFHPAE